tara:strand:+ start:303 stop:542 length:240 start_codon:yes stop_codon:yes gene_type:complete
MEDDNNTFTLDDKVHNIDEISERAKFLVFSLNELNKDRQKVEQKMAVLNAAEFGFVHQLREAVAETEDAPEEVKEGEVV